MSSAENIEAIRPTRSYVSDMAPPTLNASTASSSKSPPPRFVVIHSAGDGITRWRISLAETISFAVSKGLILVEPCVRNGRVQPCDSEELARTERELQSASSAGAHALGRRGMLRPLSAYKDTAKVRQMFPQSPNLLMPFTDFVRDWDGAALLERSRLVCAAFMSTRGCNSTYQTQVWNGHIVGNSKAARRAGSLFERVRGQPVLHLYYLKYGFFTHNMSSLTRAYAGLSTFAPALHALAKTLPEALGLSEGFFAYHWRSEKICHDYHGCSTKLLAAKAQVEFQHGIAPGRRSLLISDIAATNDSLWGGMSNGGHLHSRALQMASARALDRLLAANMTKLDSLPSMAGADPGAISVLDLLLGQCAGYLLTCASKHAKCAERCAWAGNYANFMRWLRRGRNTSVDW